MTPYRSGIHRLLFSDDNTQYDRLRIDQRGLVADSVRADHSRAVLEAVEFLGLDDSIRQQATDAYPDEFVICGPLTVAAYRATWLPELDANGHRVRRSTTE